MSHSTFAQIKFQKSYGGVGGETGHSLQITTDKGYVLGGLTNSNGSGNLDFYLVRTDSIGNLLWAKSYGTPEIEIGYSVKQTSDEGFIIAGYSESNSIYTNSVLIKTDPNGDTLWTRYYGGFNFSQCFSVEQTTDHGFILAGVVYALSNLDAQLIKTDSAGNPVWITSFGGNSHDVAYSVQQTYDGGYIVTGYMQDTGITGRNVFLAKMDSVGAIVWTKNFIGFGTDLGNSVEQTLDSGFIVCGQTLSFGNGNSDVFVIRTDKNGDTLWTKTYGGTNYDNGNSIKQTLDGGFIVSGETQSFGVTQRDGYVIKLDANGNLQWSTYFIGTDYGDLFSVQQNEDQSYVLCGLTIRSGDQEMYLIRTDSIGSSGCSEIQPLSLVGNTSIVVTNPTLIFSYPDSSYNFIPLTLNNIGTEKTICFSTSVNNISPVENLFLIYPNPSTDYFSIKFSKPILNGKLQMMDAIGKLVYQMDIFNKSEVEVNRFSKSSGIYFIRVSEGVQVFHGKIVFD